MAWTYDQPGIQYDTTGLLYDSGGVAPPPGPTLLPGGAGGGGMPIYQTGRRRFLAETLRSWCRLYMPVLRIVPEERESQLLALPPVPALETLPEAEHWPAVPAPAEAMTPAPLTIRLRPEPLVTTWYGDWWRAWEIARRVQQSSIQGF